MGHSRNAVYIFDDKSSDLPLWIQASRHEDAKSGQRVSCSIHTSASRNRNANRSLRHRCCRNSWIRLPVYYQQRVCNSSRKGGKEEWKFDPPHRGILYILPRMKRNETRCQGTRRDVPSCVPLGPHENVGRWKSGLSAGGHST